MAIQVDLATSQFGVPFAGAYFRIATAAISRQRGTNPKFNVMIDISGYGTANPEPDTREVDFRRYHAPLEDIEAILNRTFTERHDEIRDVDFVVDVNSVAELVQPETDKLLGKL